jgi:hypothetical protein
MQMASAQGAAGGESEKEKTLFQSKTNMKDDIKVLSAENDDGYRLTLILLKFHMVDWVGFGGGNKYLFICHIFCTENTSATQRARWHL